jgi:hypothetical protein
MFPQMEATRNPEEEEATAMASMRLASSSGRGAVQGCID